MNWTSAQIMQVRERQPRSLMLNEALNVQALMDSVCHVMHSPTCTSFTKIAEGGFHRVYVASLEGGLQVVVRVAFDIHDFVGSRKMESEVATLQWLRKHTSIPVPRVLYYNSGDSAVGAPYMIQEKIPGRTLERMWPTMSEAQKTEFVMAFTRITSELLCTRFTSIGSLYPSDDGCELGPMMPTCNPRYFRKDLDLDRGPWSSEKEYLLACATREIQWITSHTAALGKWITTEAGDHGSSESSAAAVADEYIAILKSVCDKIKSSDHLDQKRENLGPFALRHPDLGTENIMVSEEDPTVITGIIDWECSNTAPLWANTRIPDFLLDALDETFQDADIRASNARLREVFVSAISKKLPLVFEEERYKGDMFCALETAAQIISTEHNLSAFRRIADAAPAY